MGFLFFIVVLLAGFVGNFAPLVVTLLVTYRLARGGAVGPRKAFAGAAAFVAGALTYAVCGLAMPFVFSGGPFSSVGLLVAMGYIAAGIVGGWVLARRLHFEDKPPRTFFGEDA